MAHSDLQAKKPFFPVILTALVVLTLLALFAKGCGYHGDEHAHVSPVDTTVQHHGYSPDGNTDPVTNQSEHQANKDTLTHH